MLFLFESVSDLMHTGRIRDTDHLKWKVLGYWFMCSDQVKVRTIQLY